MNVVRYAIKLKCKPKSVMVSLGKRSEVVIGSCYEGGCRKWGSALHQGLGRSPRSLCICGGSKTKIDCHEYQRKPEAMLVTVTIAFCIIYINGTNNLFQLMSFLSRYKLMHPHSKYYSVHYRALFRKAKEQHCTDLLCCNYQSMDGM